MTGSLMDNILHVHGVLQRPVEVLFIWVGIHSTKPAKKLLVLVGFFSKELRKMISACRD